MHELSSSAVIAVERCSTALLIARVIGSLLSSSFHLPLRQIPCLNCSCLLPWGLLEVEYAEEGCPHLSEEAATVHVRLSSLLAQSDLNEVRAIE